MVWVAIFVSAGSCCSSVAVSTRVVLFSGVTGSGSTLNSSGVVHEEAKANEITIVANNGKLTVIRSGVDNLFTVLKFNMS